MPIATLNFRGLLAEERVLRTHEIVDATTNNEWFVTPNPSLADMSKSADDLEKANNSTRTGGKEATRKLNLAKQKNNRIMAAFTLHVQVESGGDQVKIEPPR